MASSFIRLLGFRVILCTALHSSTWQKRMANAYMMMPSLIRDFRNDIRVWGLRVCLGSISGFQVSCGFGKDVDTLWVRSLGIHG